MKKENLLETIMSPYTRSKFSINKFNLTTRVLIVVRTLKVNDRDPIFSLSLSVND